MQQPQVSIYGLPVLGDHVLSSLEVDGNALDSTEQLLRFAQKLRGQFAIIVEGGSNSFALTDPMGSYPVYYITPPNHPPHLSSCALDLARQVGVNPCPQAIFSYAALGINTSAESFFAGVHRMPSGSILQINGTGQLRVTPYFSWDEALGVREVGWEEARTLFKECFRSYVGAIVRHQPKGACLFSSGIDSALIAALLMREFPESHLQGYSVDYTGFFRWRYSEFGDALINSRVLGLDLKRVKATGQGCYRALHDILSHPPDFPPADRALPIQFLSLLAGGTARPPVYYTGFNADRPFCGHERWRRLSYEYSRAYNTATPRLTAEEKARILGLPDPRRVSAMKPLIEAAGLSERDFDSWLADHVQKHIAHLRHYEALDFLRLIQLLSEEEIGMLWADEHLLLERTFGVNFVSPFGDMEMVRLGFALPLHRHFHGNETKSFLRNLLKKETGLVCEKRAFPSPMRFWALMPAFFSVCHGRHMRRLCQAIWARNTGRLGSDYPLAYSFMTLAAWLERMSFC